MGEKKQYRLQMEFPFYTQRMTQETWEEEGFSSFPEADSWTFRSCGIAWIHWGLAKLAADYGIYGEALREKTAEDLKQELDAGHPCMVSVASFFQGGKPKPDGSGVYGKSGHLVPVLGYETEDGRLTAFLVHHPSAFLEQNKPNWWVPIEDFSASFGGNFIRFSTENFSEEDK